MSVTKPINICGKKDCSDSNDCVGPLTEITSSFQSVFKKKGGKNYTIVKDNWM